MEERVKVFVAYVSSDLEAKVNVWLDSNKVSIQRVVQSAASGVVILTIFYEKT